MLNTMALWTALAPGTMQFVIWQISMILAAWANSSQAHKQHKNHTTAWTQVNNVVHYLSAHHQVIIPANVVMVMANVFQKKLNYDIKEIG